MLSNVWTESSFIIYYHPANDEFPSLQRRSGRVSSPFTPPRLRWALALAGGAARRRAPRPQPLPKRSCRPLRAGAGLPPPPAQGKRELPPRHRHGCSGGPRGGSVAQPTLLRARGARGETRDPARGAAGLLEAVS